MKFSAIKLCALVGLASLILMGFRSHGQPVAPAGDNQPGVPTANKVLVSPSVTESGLTVTQSLPEKEETGKRLRLIQFRGPVTPSWLASIKSSGAQVVSYAANNTYLVFIDAKTEKGLEPMREPSGPIQWIGDYQPSSKIARELRFASGTEPLRVRVGIVDVPQEESGVFAMGIVRSTLTRGGQQIVEMEVQPSAIARMAQLADVLWIQKVARHVPLDEVQDLLITTQTNAPGFGPSITTGITNYLDFLTNTVGGGLVSFTNQASYPIVDVADTGLDVGLGRDQQHQPVVAQPNFLDPNGRSRVAYLEPGLNGYFPAPFVVNNDELGCAGLNDNFNQNDIVHSADDFYGHGTFVASIVAGYDVQPNTFGLFIYSTIITQSFSSSISAASVIGCAGQIGNGTGIFTFATQPCPLVTNISVACASLTAPTIFQSLNLPTMIINTQLVFAAVEHQDPTGFQFGLGVSPFG